MLKPPNEDFYQMKVKIAMAAKAPAKVGIATPK